MGQNVDNEQGPSPVHEGSSFKGWGYSIGRGNPALHDPSPFMTRAELDDVLAQADESEQDWLDAHPLDVKTWLQGKPSAVRARFQESCRKY